MTGVMDMYGFQFSPSGPAPVAPGDYTSHLAGFGPQGSGLTPAGTAVAPDQGLFSSFLPKKYADGSTGGGWGSVGLGLAQGGLNAYLGLQQLGVARDTLKENKKQFQMNFDAQRQTTNSALEDRQRARVASNPGAYQSVGDYMSLNGIR